MNAAATSAAFLAAALAACSPRPRTTSCRANLGGVWRDPGGRRWMILDQRDALEVYPLFDDASTAGNPPVTAAPRMIELHRSRAGLTGEVRRRFERRGAHCESHAAVSVTACRGDSLELVIGDAAAPLALAPCTWGRPAPARAERWRRD